MKNNLIELGKRHGMDIEIYEEKTNKCEINTLNDTLKSFEVSDVSTFIIKTIKEGKFAKIVTEKIDADMIIENLEAVFLLQDNTNENRLSKGVIKSLTDTREDIDYEKVKKDLFSLVELKKDYPMIKSIEASFGHYQNGKFITNENATLEQDGVFTLLMVSITLQKDAVTKIMYYSFYNNCYDFTSFLVEVKKKLDRMVLKIDSRSCKTNKYKVILQNNVVADLLGTFVGMFHAKDIYLKESILADKFNTKIFSDKISVIEDPKGDSALIKEAFDDEGVETQFKTIVENGVFVKQINNIEYALKLHTEATGNAGGVNNLYIKEKDSSFDQLVNKMQNGIIIDEAFGFHSGVDTKSGNISLQAEGLVVEDGKIVRALHMIILSTNLFELFNSVIDVGNDMSNTDLEIRCPSILFENITIAGEENE